MNDKKNIFLKINADSIGSFLSGIHNWMIDSPTVARYRFVIDGDIFAEAAVRATGSTCRQCRVIH